MEKLKFSLTIDGVFNILTRGILVTGTVEKGSIKTGDKLILVENDTLAPRCISMERYLKPINEAHQGEYVAIFLSDISRYDLKKGMTLIIKE